MASALLSVLNVLLNYGTVRAYSIARGSAAASSLAVVIIELIFSILFWFLIIRRASNGAKWIVTALAGVGLLGLIPMELGAYEGLTPFYLVCSAVVTVLNLVGISFLFRRDAVQWLRSRGAEGEVDPRVFN